MFARLRSRYPGPGQARTLIRAVVGSAGLRIFGMGLGFLVGVQLARGLGPAGYGVYGIAMSIISVLMIPTEFGIPQLVTREVAAAGASGDVGLVHRILAWSAKFVAANSLFLVLVTGVTLMWGLFSHTVELERALMWGLLLLPTVALSNIWSAALRGQHRIIQGQVAELFIRPAVLATTLYLSSVWIGGDLLTPSHAMALNVLSAILGASFAIWAIGKMPRVAAGATLPKDVRRGWLASAVPLAMGDGMRIISGQLAMLLLGAIATVADAGMYRVAFGIYTVATLPSALLNAACSPMLAKLHREGRQQEIQRLNAWMTFFLVASAIACVVPFAIAGTEIIGLVFGAEYRQANSILLVLLVGEIASAMLGHPTIVLNMLRREKAVTYFSLMALALNFFISILLVPHFGAIGAAFGVALSQFAWRFSAAFYARRQLNLHTSVLSWIRRG